MRLPYASLETGFAGHESFRPQRLDSGETIGELIIVAQAAGAALSTGPPTATPCVAVRTFRIMTYG